MAAEAIVKGGAKKVLVESGTENIEVARDRLKVVEKVLNENNIDYEVIYSQGYDFESAKEFAKYVKTTIGKYDSIIACNDLYGICSALELSRNGVYMPNDVQIMGYDDTIFSKLSNPNLYTIKHDGGMLGIKVAEMLIDLIEKKEVEEKRFNYFRLL